MLGESEQGSGCGGLSNLGLNDLQVYTSGYEETIPGGGMGGLAWSPIQTPPSREFGFVTGKPPGGRGWEPRGGLARSPGMRGLQNITDYNKPPTYAALALLGVVLVWAYTSK